MAANALTCRTCGSPIAAASQTAVAPVIQVAQSPVHSVGGKTLAQLRQERGGVMPEREAIAYIRRAARLIADLHSTNRIHGALTLQAIEVAGDGNLRLRGTAATAFSEAGRGDDVRALAQVLWQLLAGHDLRAGSDPRPFECSAATRNALRLALAAGTTPPQDIMAWAAQLTPVPVATPAQAPMQQAPVQQAPMHKATSTAVISTGAMSKPEPPQPVKPLDAGLRWAPIRRITSGKGSIRDLSFSVDGKEIWSGSEEGTVQIWSAITGAPLASLDTRFKAGAVTSYAFDSTCVGKRNRDWVATGHEDGRIRVWDVRANKQNRVLDAHDGAVCALRFAPLLPNAPALQNLASGGRDGALHLWNAESGQRLQTVREDSGNVRTIAVHGTQVAAGCDGGRVEMWHSGAGRLVWSSEMHEFWISALAFASNGRILASGGYDCSVRVWSADSGLELHSFFDCTANVTDLAFALDSRLLAASASDGSVHLWDAWSGTALQPLPDLGGACSAIAWSPGGRILATASDTQLLLWHREG